MCTLLKSTNRYIKVGEVMDRQKNTNLFSHDASLIIISISNVLTRD